MRKYIRNVVVKIELKSGVEAFNKKIIVSGSVVEIYEYEKTMFKGKSSSGGRHHTDSENTEKNREITLNRARKDIRRIINSNVGKYDEMAKFITLTFADNVTDVKVANYEFLKYVKRLNYDIFGSKKAILKYTVVPEVQKRGSIHYHCVFYNMPYVKHAKLLELWNVGDEVKKGSLNVKKIEHVDNIGAYVCKYLTKDTSSVFEGKKCYFNARGLYKPEEIYKEKEVTSFSEELTTSYNFKLTYNSIYTNDYTGKIEYMQYVKK